MYIKLLSAKQKEKIKKMKQLKRYSIEDSIAGTYMLIDK